MLYLVRHGKAEAGPVDAERRLTEKGRRAVRAVADRLAEADVQVDRVEHSGLVRARETAEILQDQLGGDLVEEAGLRPEDDVAETAERLGDLGDEDVMLVGHNPFMEDLAALLMTGNADAGTLHFRTAAVACLSQNGRRWTLEWFLYPDLA